MTETDPTKQGGQLNSSLKKGVRVLPVPATWSRGTRPFIKHGADCRGCGLTDTVASVSKCPCSRVKESVHARRTRNRKGPREAADLLPCPRVGGLSEPFATPIVKAAPKGKTVCADKRGLGQTREDSGRTATHRADTHVTSHPTPIVTYHDERSPA